MNIPIELIRIITGFTGTVAFGIIFNVRGKFLVLSSVGGFIAVLGYEIFNFLGFGEMLNCFLIASIITLYSEILARIVKTPTTTFIIPALIPLIPGGALYYTMSNALAKNWKLCFDYAYYASRVALGIAVGIILITTIIQLINIYNSHLHKKY